MPVEISGHESAQPLNALPMQDGQETELYGQATIELKNQHVYDRIPRMPKVAARQMHRLRKLSARLHGQISALVFPGVPNIEDIIVPNNSESHTSEACPKNVSALT